MAVTETTTPPGETDAAQLAAIRATIDRLDSEMHQCLIERGTAISALVRVKGTSRPGAAFRPGREADMMRRLVDRHAGALPLWTVEHIWREIITTFTRMQASFDVAYDAGLLGAGLLGALGHSDAMRDVARFLFGFTVALHRQQGPLDTINHVRESGTDLGLVALAQPSEAGAWWRALGRPSGPRIMALAPFIAVVGRPADLPVLVIAPELADPAPPELTLFAVSAIGADAARVIRAAGGTVMAEAGREMLVALPAATSPAVLSARAGFDDIAKVGALSCGIAIGAVDADPVLYRRIEEA